MSDRFSEVVGRDVPRETYELLEGYCALLREENSRQNLISASTIDRLWDRHILDSAQLVPFETRSGASWLDIGSGAGLPGIVIAALISGPITLVEPRRLRADFLTRAVRSLCLHNTTVQCAKVEKVEGRFEMITARAVAPLTKLLEMSTHLSTRNTCWVLPKGRNAQSELAAARQNWHCEAEIVPSRTDPDSGILVLRDLKRRGSR
jgi:16S rRNA (guanine527-N7)-methyltransferase